MDLARACAEQALALHAKNAAGPDAEPAQLDAFARFLLECRPEDLRDPRAALVQARRAAASSGEKDAAILETLSLALEAAGERAEALAALDKALALLPPGGEAPVELRNARLRARIEERLASLGGAGAGEGPP